MAQQVLQVMKPGLATSVQDLGRTGYQQYGMVVSGAMDAFALQLSNLLVGNRRGAAALEITLIGPELFVLQDTIIAICGADLTANVDGEEIPLWQSLRVKKGQTVRFGRPRVGVYAYLAVAGGIVVPPVMGSRSTYVKAGLGGVAGRHLKKGDVLRSGNRLHVAANEQNKRLAPSLIPAYRSAQTVRVMLGPDHEAFDPASIETFLSRPYTVTAQSDRMGYRLSGPKLRHVSGADIVSDAILPGAVQVPANGEPIILLADRQTTGGYARIATVATVDLPYVAQMPPNSKLTFAAIPVADAQRLLIERETLLRKMSVAVY